MPFTHRNTRPPHPLPPSPPPTQLRRAKWRLGGGFSNWKGACALWLSQKVNQPGVNENAESDTWLMHIDTRQLCRVTPGSLKITAEVNEKKGVISMNFDLVGFNTHIAERRWGTCRYHSSLRHFTNQGLCPIPCWMVIGCGNCNLLALIYDWLIISQAVGQRNCLSALKQPSCKTNGGLNKCIQIYIYTYWLH